MLTLPQMCVCLCECGVCVCAYVRVCVCVCVRVCVRMCVQPARTTAHNGYSGRTLTMSATCETVVPDAIPRYSARTKWRPGYARLPLTVFLLVILCAGLLQAGRSPDTLCSFTTTTAASTPLSCTSPWTPHSKAGRGTAMLRPT